ncbi:MAG: tetratricopeptide repeat protein, partial [Candidatus Acidiferrum sp.]
MTICLPKTLSFLSVAALLLFPLGASCAMPPQSPAAPDPSSGVNEWAMVYGSANAEIHVNGPDGAPTKAPAIVTLLGVGGQMYGQNTAKDGFVKFERVPYTEFTVQVVAPGYATASKEFEVNGPGAVSITLSLKPLEAEEAAESRGFYALPRNVQRDVGKALEALRADKPNNAIKHLEAAQRGAPQSPEIEYLFSVYSTETKDTAEARVYWMKTLALDPRHLSTLLAVGQDDLQSNKSADALPYLKRAIQVEPNSWRAQLLYSEALVMEKMNDEATQHALRAIDLGHDNASAAQLVLVRALVQKGEMPKAISKLEEYVKAHPTDKDTANYLEKLKNPPAGSNPGASAGEMSVVSNDEDALPVPSNWLPPDVDASVPAVEPGVACNVDDVVRKAGQQLVELAKDVDRFTATETLTHQSIDKYGLPSAPEKRTFSYVASIEEVNHKFLNVEEYRLDKDGGPAQFPEGVATNGLPALVLIF